MTRASGTFVPVLTPREPDDPVPTLGQLDIAKTFEGDLAGTSAGTMLSAGTDVEGSAGYVALELVTAQLQDRRGTFALQHFATMKRGAPYLRIEVVPDSGTDDLVGITGSMAIDIAQDGTHSYDLEYTLPQP